MVRWVLPTSTAKRENKFTMLNKAYKKNLNLLMQLSFLEHTLKPYQKITIYIT